MTDRTKVGILFNTLDRFELTKMSFETMLSGIDPAQHDVTLYWQDGSLEKNARRYFESITSNKLTLIKCQELVRGIGAAAAIEKGMIELSTIGEFDWFGTAESDVYFRDSWLSSCLDAVAHARKDGLNPGIVTPYVLHKWILEYGEHYLSMTCCGATCSLFTPEAWKLVPSIEIGHHFNRKVFRDFGYPEYVTTYEETGSVWSPGWDWSFGPSVYHGGLDVIGTRDAQVFNCGIEEISRVAHPEFSYVAKNDPCIWNGQGPVKINRKNHEAWIAALENSFANSQMKKVSKKIIVKKSIKKLFAF